MGGKIIAVVLITFYTLLLILDIKNISQWHVYDYLYNVLLVINLIGIYSFSFKQPIFSKKIWRIFLGLILASIIYSSIIHLFPQSINSIPNFLIPHNFYPTSNLFAIIIVNLSNGLLLYFLYLLSFKKIEASDNQVKTSGDFIHISLIRLVSSTIFTLGLYIPIWFIEQMPAINKLHSPEKLYKNTFIIMLAIQIISIVLTLLLPSLFFLLLDNQIKAEDTQFIIKLAQLIPSVMLIMQIFKVRRIFIDHYNNYLKKNITISGLFTFLFYIFYFQYLINKLDKK